MQDWLNREVSQDSVEIEKVSVVNLQPRFTTLFFRRAMVFAYLLLPIVTATVWSLVICFALFDRVNVVAITFTRCSSAWRWTTAFTR